MISAPRLLDRFETLPPSRLGHESPVVPLPRSGPTWRLIQGLCLTALIVAWVTPASAQAEPDGDEASEEASDEANELWVTSLAVLPDSEGLIAATATSLVKREAAVLRIDAEGQATELYKHPAAVWQVVATGDGKTLVSVDYEGNLATYDLKSSDANRHDGILERWCPALAAAPDSTAVVAGNEAGKLFVWNLQSAEVSQTKSLDEHSISSIAFSPDGSEMAIADGGGHVHRLAWPSLDSIDDHQVSEEPAWSVAYRADGKSLLVGCGDRKLYRCGTSGGEGQSEAIFTGSDWITQIAISEDGQICIGEVGGKIHLIRIPPTGDAEVTSELKAKSSIWSIAWGKNELLIGTRRHGLQTASRSWKWSDE